MIVLGRNSYQWSMNDVPVTLTLLREHAVNYRTLARHGSFTTTPPLPSRGVPCVLDCKGVRGQWVSLPRGFSSLLM